MPRRQEIAMADTFVDVKLIEGFVLPYESGAEQYLGDLKPLWDAIAALYPGLRLDPLFASVDVQTLTDMVDVGRMQGEEPPDPFAWFEVPCDDAVADTILVQLQALPFIEWAEPREELGLVGFVGYGTNPETRLAHQLNAAPYGVDAPYAWRVAGGTAPGIHVADVEHGWKLDHEDLVTASITPFSVFGTPNAEDIDHGTAVMGILLGSDNGVGVVGIAPDAQGFLVTETRRSKVNLAAALVAAGEAARPGGVVLIELGVFKPWILHPEHDTPTVPVELSRAIQIAIRLLVFFGITVVEPAGNGDELGHGAVDLDAHPEFNHFNPAHPSFEDSRAIVVGGALWTDDYAGGAAWYRTSSWGARVDCFARYADMRSPSTLNGQNYQEFSGTSGASATIAGVVCAIQGMSEAANNGQPLFPTDIRALLRNPELGTPTGPTFPGPIRTMPDLRKIAAYMGWPRILPVAAMPVADDSAVLVQLDGNDRLSRRVWSKLSGLAPNIPLPATCDFPLSACTPAVLVTVETWPVMRTTYEVLTTGNDGALRYFYWDPLGNNGNLAAPRTPVNTVAPGYDVAASRPIFNEIFPTVCAIAPSARLISLFYDATVMGPHGFSSVTIDSVGNYRRTPGPMMVSRKPRLMDVVAIEDGGTLFWSAGVLGPDNIPFWHAPVPAQGDVPLEPRVKPGLIGNLDGIATVAVGTDGLLYACGFGMQPFMFETLTTISPAPLFARQGQIGLGLTIGNTLVAVAVGADSLLYATFRPLVLGGNWSPLIPIDAYTQVSPLGGAIVVTQGDRVMVFAVLPDGRPCRADYTPGTGWSALSAG
jgi:hypothetical protein